MAYRVHCCKENLIWSDQTSNSMTACAFRPVKGVRGFSRETLIAVITNIESQEFRRREASSRGKEHPRASSGDDVECFFSILHEQLGKDFTMKAVQNRWRVLCTEFCKQLDTNLPFYYHTSDKERYKITDMPSFDLPPSRTARLDSLRVSRREHIGRHIVGRSAMLSRGSQTIRQQFHSGPVELPAPHQTEN